MITESQRLERLAERLRAIEPATPSPTAKIRAWNLVVAEVQNPANGGRSVRSPARLLLAGLAAAVLLAAGTAAVAVDSLPDSALYPIKGSIEAVQGAFALTPADRLSYHLSLAHSRLREAEAMFARHRVDLAGHALTAMEDQLTGAAVVVKAARSDDPATGASLARELAQAVATHDTQLAGLQGQVSNPAALHAITEARSRAQAALKTASASGDGQVAPDPSPSPTVSGQASSASPSASATGSPNP